MSGKPARIVTRGLSGLIDLGRLVLVAAIALWLGWWSGLVPAATTPHATADGAGAAFWGPRVIVEDESSLILTELSAKLS